MPFLFIWILNKKKMVTVATAQSKQWRLRLRNYKHHGSFCAKSSICHVHLHDLSHATAIVFMITGLALIFYGPPCQSSSCHVHGPPCTSPSYSGSQSSSSFSYFIYVLMLTADARSRSRLLDATFAAVFGHVRCVWPRSLCLASPVLF